MIRSATEPVFLGVVVQPKTKAPVYVQRPSGKWLTAEIIAKLGEPPWAAPPAYGPVGSGYLNDMEDYAGATEITGFPRSHTSEGVSIRGMGYGTAVYTALVLLATAEHDKALFVRDLIGSGSGICSTEADSRSVSATRWWRASRHRGLTTMVSGTTSPDQDEPEMELEELDDENARDYLSSRTYRDLEGAVANAFNNIGEWDVTDVSIRVDIRREVPRESDERSAEDIDVDIYTMESAEQHNLVACQETMAGDMFAWAARPFGQKFVGHKEVILALNVAGEDSRMVGKLALAAQAEGATDREITAMLMRNRIGVDVVSRKVMFEEPPSPKERELMEMLGVEATSSKRRPPPATERGHRLPPHPNPHVPIRRNPAPTLTAGDRQKIDRDLAELEKRRTDLGWNDLEDLP